MSVIHFEFDQLGNIAGCAVGGPLASDMGKSALARFSESLAAISEANAAAYNSRYPNERAAKAASAKEIAHWAQTHVTSLNCKRAHGDAQSLAYNSKPTPEANEGLAHVLTAMLRRCER